MDKFIEKDTQGPSVDFVSVWVFIHHFWCHVLERATERLSIPREHIALRILLKLDLTSPAKVANLYHLLVVDEQVFRLQIPVNEPVLVHEVNAANSLNEVPKRVTFVEALFLGDALEEVLLLDELHDEVLVLAVLQVRVESHDIDVLELLMNLYLPPQRLLHLWLHQALLEQLLHRQLLSSWLVNGQVHITVCSLAQALALVNLKVV